MTAQEIRQAYLNFFEHKGHKAIPRAKLIPYNDPTTLFTGSGMQPLLPYLLGQTHPEGDRLVDSQTCLRAQDIDEVGDNRHTTFFEMLGNWSLGSYFKSEQLTWLWEFLTKTLQINPNKLYISCFIGSKNHQIPKDTESAEIWQKLLSSSGVDNKTVDIGSIQTGAEQGMQDGRIFYYDASKNWWCRTNQIDTMPEGEPGGPDSEVFYQFEFIKHDETYGKYCHPNCDCGRFLEIGNSVFMEYVKAAIGFNKLPKRNVDFGGGLERLAAAALDEADIFKTSLIWPIIIRLEELSLKKYDSHTESMRIIADHLRAVTFLAIDGLIPSNKEQGYVMRRLLRRAIRFAFELGVEQNLCQEIAPIIIEIYRPIYPEIEEDTSPIVNSLIKEEKVFRQTLRKGLHEFDKLLGAQFAPKNTSDKKVKLTGELLFKLYDTFGFPVELSKEEAYKRGISIDENADKEFEDLMQQQRTRSRTATQGEFKGGLADHSEITTKYHTATHLMYRTLRNVLGEHVVQRGSNITPERLRFDFSQPEKLTSQQIENVETIVNQQIDKDWPVSWREEPTKQALSSGVLGAFGDRYGDIVKVYTIGDPNGDYYSREICGGPHVEHTGQLAENGKRFKIIKEESSSAGVRRIKAVLQ